MQYLNNNESQVSTLIKFYIWSVLFESPIKLRRVSQINPCQIYSSQKLHNYGFYSNSEFTKEIDKFFFIVFKE